MKQMFRTITAYLLSLIFFFSFFSSYALAERPTLQYVALGDSLAAGFLNSEEIGDGYPVYVAQGIEESTAYQVNLTNFGVGGYTTVHLLEQLEKEHVQQSLKEADIITIDIGANDILSNIGKNFDLTDPNEMQSIVQEVTKALLTIKINLKQIFTNIQELNSNAPIFFMGYYNALPYIEGQDLIELMMTIFNDALKETSESFGAIFVPTYEAFAGKYDIYLPNPKDIHPNKEGYELIASLFLAEILPLLPPISSVPEITLHGDNPIELHVGDTYVEPGATAFDSIDGDLSDEIVITGEVNTSEAGTYTLTYSVTNSLGETATAERKIHVLKVDDATIQPPKKQEEPKPKPQQTKKDNDSNVKTNLDDKIGHKKSKTGNQLPKTATTYSTIVFIGIMLIIIGSIFLLYRIKEANVLKNIQN